jgi:hypothetical protein
VRVNAIAPWREKKPFPRVFGGKKSRRKAVPAAASRRKSPSPARVTAVDLTRSPDGGESGKRRPPEQVPHALSEQRDVIDETVITARDLHEARTTGEPVR